MGPQWDQTLARSILPGGSDLGEPSRAVPLRVRPLIRVSRGAAFLFLQLQTTFFTLPAGSLLSFLPQRTEVSQDAAGGGIEQEHPFLERG